VSRRTLRAALTGAALLAGIAVVAASLVVPTLLLLHTDLVKMAIDDPELREVWPQLAPGVQESKKDHYCNLSLNLQKVAYETGTIELDEFQGALAHLMASRDMYSFWEKARAARVDVTSGDEAEDFFTSEIDKAFAAVSPPRPQSLIQLFRSATGQWRAERRRRR
jgi:hypothetical protein